jgi:hypothetical protein
MSVARVAGAVEVRGQPLPQQAGHGGQQLEFVSNIRFQMDGLARELPQTQGEHGGQDGHDEQLGHSAAPAPGAVAVDPVVDQPHTHIAPAGGLNGGAMFVVGGVGVAGAEGRGAGVLPIRSPWGCAGACVLMAGSAGTGALALGLMAGTAGARRSSRGWGKIDGEGAAGVVAGMAADGLSVVGLGEGP